MAGLIPDIDPRAGKALGTFSALVVLVIVLLLCWISIDLLQGTLDGRHWPGRGLLLLMDYRPTELIGKGLLFLLGLGAGVVARSKGKDTLYFITVGAGFLGVVLCVILVIVLHDPDVAHAIFDYSPLEAITTYESYVQGLTLVFVPLGLWLIGNLAAQLGVSLPAAAGDPPPVPGKAK